MPKITLTIEFYEFLEGLQCTATVDTLTGNINALFDALLSLLQHLNTESSVGQYDVLLGRQGTVLEYAVEDLCSLFLRRASYEFFGLGNLKTEVTGLEDAP